MRDEMVQRLLAAFDRQQEIIEAQCGIIDQLYRLAAMHVSAEELMESDITKEIERVNEMKGEQFR